VAGEPDRNVKVRRRRKKRFYRQRKYILGGGIVLLLGLLIANAYFIFGRSPERMRVKYLQNGFKAYELKNYEEARLNFERYVREDPRRPNMWYMLGLSQFQLGHHRQGVEALQEAIRLRPGFNHAHTALSEHYRRQGQQLLALRSAERAIATNPVPEDAWVALGEARMALGKMEGAVDAFRRAVQVNPALIDTLLKLADLYYTREKLGLEDVNAGLAKMRYEQADIQAQQLLTVNPDNVRALVWRAKARAGQGFLSDALEDLTTVVDAEPKIAAHRLLLARFQNARQDYEEEVKTLRTAWEETPDPAIPVRLARTLTHRLLDPEGGRQALERGIERFPDDPGLRIALVGHLTRRQELAGAREVMDQALVEFPGDSLILEAAGDLSMMEGDREVAISALRSSVEARGENFSARRKLIGLLVEDYLRAVENGDLAETLRAELDRSLSFFLDEDSGINPTDLLARSFQARLYFADGRFEDAALLLGEEGGGVPRSYEGLKILGLARLQSGKHEGASDAFLAALHHPSCPHTLQDFDLAYTTAFRIGRVSREVDIARAAVLRWPQDADWRIRLATSLYRQGSFSEAVGECELAGTLLAGSRDVRPHLLAARIYQAQGEITRARGELEEAVLIRRDAETRGALYSFMAATGDEQLGEDGFRALVDENSSDPKVLLAFGDFLLSRAGKAGIGSERDLKREALRQYQTALSLNPDSRDALRRVVELRMALAATREEAVAFAEEIVARITESGEADPHLDYFKGKLHILKEEYEEAVVALSQYVRSNPDDSAGQYYLAIAYRRSGHLDKAKNGFLAALGTDPAMVEAKLELATLYFSQGIQASWRGELENARSSFEHVLEIDPRQPEAHRFMAETMAGLGLLDAAAMHAEKVLEEQPDDRGALFLSGLFKARRGKLKEAQGRFEHLVSVASDNPRAHLYLGMILAEQRQPDGALASFRRAYELEPDGNDVLRAIAITEISAGRSAAALDFVESVRDRTPRRAYVHQLLGDLYLAVNRPEDAIESLQRAFELDPSNSDSLAFSVTIMARLGRMEEAIETLRSGMEPAGYPSTLFLLEGRFHLSLGAREDAELAFREALRRDAGELDAYAELGRMLSEGGREEEGRRMLEEAVRRGTRSPAVFFKLAWLAELHGSEDVAIDHYRRALALAPDDPVTLNNLAMILARQSGALDEAVKVATRARELRPDDPYVADTLGFVLLKADRLKEAVPLLLEAAKALRENAEVQHHAGMACYRNYEWEEARRHLKRALRLAPDAPTAGEAREALKKIR